ncbi:hypothetical protein MLD38_002976 [Melastoma candidum]|uniref:Uncharacterized protein n=1 Tax=Melastoma candidum TaxID=119954 RepID=A0ACB9S0C5_9MYRT|nr:hypothetical protein MLD38_002976 [Melastoma candidum]
MGEEAKQEQEQPKTEVPEKAEAAKPEDASKQLQPVILSVDLHCIGCTKKIERSIVRIEGVEGVVVDTAQNQVTIRGGQFDPQAVCDRILKKTRRRAKVLSPLLPTPPPDNVKPQIPAAVDPAVTAPPIRTVKLNVNMHCEACADQLKRKIIKMEGVEKVETELGSGKVTVTGTMNADKLVEYVYRQTKKQAQIVPQPEPETGSKNQEGGDKDKKKEVEKKPAEDAGQGKEDDGKEAGEKKQVGGEEEEVAEDVMKWTMVNYYQYQQQPLHVMERMFPHPQLFSDDNPNACSIS